MADVRYLVCLRDGRRFDDGEAADGACPACGDSLAEESDVRRGLDASAVFLQCAACSKHYRVKHWTRAQAVSCPTCSRPLAVIDATTIDAQAAEPRAPEVIGSSFGRYRLISELGKGGFGTVHLAHDAGLDRRVALKILTGHEPHELARFKREAHLAAGLSHPNIAAVYEVGEVGEQPYIAMQYIEGETLAKLRLTPREALEAIRDAARAVAYAHEHGVIHRDLKPANIMRSQEGRIFVLDFGLAKSVGAETSLSMTGDIMGTPFYMSPEQAQGEVRAVDARSDVWALGATLYELVTGQRPFNGAGAIDVLRQVLEAEPVPPRRINPRLDSDIETIVLKCLEKDPSRRYESAAALEADLARFLDAEPIEARPPSTFYRLRKKLMKRKAVVGTVLAAVLVVGVVLGTLLPTLIGRTQELTEAQSQALAYMREQTDAYLDAALANRRAGDLEKMRGYAPKVEAVCREVIGKAPSLAEPHYRLGRMYRALLRFDEALEQQNEALRKDPKYGPALYERSILRSQAYGDRLALLHQRALAEEGARLAGEGFLHPLAIGEATLRVPSRADVEASAPELGDLRAGIVSDLLELKAVEGVSPSRIAAAEGILLLRRGRIAEAEERLAEAVEADPLIEEAYEALAECAAAEERFEAAVDWCGRGLERDRGYVPHLTRRASIHLAWGLKRAARGEDPVARYEAAIASLDEVLRLGHRTGDVLTRRAELHLKLGSHESGLGRDPAPHFERALADADKAILMNPLAAEAFLWRGQTRLNWGTVRSGDEEESFYRLATADFDAALRIDPNLVVALISRGQVNNNLGVSIDEEAWDPGMLYAEAIADFDAALRLDPARVDALIRRSLARDNWASYKMHHGGDASELFGLAIADLDAALLLDPESAKAFARRGAIHLRLADAHLDHQGLSRRDLQARAMKDFDASLRQNPHFAEALWGRGFCNYLWGRWAECLADFDRAAELDPKGVDRYSRFRDEARRALDEF